MRNVISGIIIIAIGMANGGSIFTGDPTGFDYAFDLLGMGLIGYGIFETLQNRG